MFNALRTRCAREAFWFNYEQGSKALSHNLSQLVSDIFHALTGKEVTYEAELPTSSGQVISDFSYRVDDGVQILGEAKSPKAFNYFIGELMYQMRDESPAQLCGESGPITCRGYESILAKVRVVVFISHLLSGSSLPLACVSCG
jgi:hypothetical protein